MRIQITNENISWHKYLKSRGYIANSGVYINSALARGSEKLRHSRPNGFLGKFVCFPHSHRYYDGPFCTPMQLLHFEKINFFKSRMKFLLFDEVAKCRTKKRKKIHKIENF